MTCEEIIKEIISKNIPNIDNNILLVDDDLQKNGMDSFCFIKIIIDLEIIYKIRFPEYRLLPTELNTIRKFCEVITELINNDLRK